MAQKGSKRLVPLLGTLSLAVTFGLMALTGCASKTAGLWTRPDPADLPADIQTWMADSRPLEAGQTRTVGETTYVLVGWGRQTEGSKVEITDVGETPGGPADVRVTVRYTPSTQPPTAGSGWPQDLVAISRPDVKVAWVVEGDPSALVFEVLGPVEPIVAESRWIKLFNPAPDSVTTSPITLSGLANVFEGTVNYRLVLADGTVVDQGYVTGAMAAWGPFTAAVNFSPEAAGLAGARLEVFWISPEDGAELDLISVPLQLETAG